MPDADLVKALKLAKSKKMFFAFVPKGATGKLIISKARIPAKLLAQAKKEIGGGNPITGKCSGPPNDMVFLVAKAAPPTLAAALKKVAKDAGLAIVPDVQLAGDADDEEEDTGDEGAVVDETASPEEAEAADAEDEDEDEDESDEEDETPDVDADSEDEDEDEEESEDETDDEALDLGPWQSARQNAITDLKALAKKVAGTKHPDAAGVLKEINSIMTKLPANPTAKDVDRLHDLISNDDTIAAAEEVPGHFHALDLRGPLLQALQGLKK
jgi:hypothetical protein